jgi:beta-lactamase superfamily II metal-dependent hydrolase
MTHRFVALRADGKPSYLYQANRKTKARQVLWGDYLTISRDMGDGWLEVDWAPRSPTQRRKLYVPANEVIEKRPLEIIFVDVGQGDGAVVISPERGARERIMVIDAGEGGNMNAFLKARFQTYAGFNFHAAVLTHPDQDHYQGFLPLFQNPKVGFKTVYHNGLVERPVKGTWEKIGQPITDATTGHAYIHALAVDRPAIQMAFGGVPPDTPYEFPRLMKAALDNPKVGDIRMLSTAHAQLEQGKAWMPGFGPSDQRGYTIQVLGPVVEPGAQGTQRLRRLGSFGETKNGHSVLLKLTHGSFNVLFGGDLNLPAEKFLLTHHTGLATWPREGSTTHRRMVDNARATFRAEVMKSCHHGSSEVTDAFLQAVNPAAFVISSGDEEGFVHPRPDLLGRLGAAGRGAAPVILSTELQRSTRAREDRQLVDALLARVDALANGVTPEQLEHIKKDVRELGRSNVEVYGAIYLKTDGQRLMTAFKIESGSDTQIWFYFLYTFNTAGELVLS